MSNPQPATTIPNVEAQDDVPFQEDLSTQPLVGFESPVLEVRPLVSNNGVVNDPDVVGWAVYADEFFCQGSNAEAMGETPDSQPEWQVQPGPAGVNEQPAQDGAFEVPNQPQPNYQGPSTMNEPRAHWERVVVPLVSPPNQESGGLGSTHEEQPSLLAHDHPADEPPANQQQLLGDINAVNDVILEVIRPEVEDYMDEKRNVHYCKYKTKVDEILVLSNLPPNLQGLPLQVLVRLVHRTEYNPNIRQRYVNNLRRTTGIAVSEANFERDFAMGVEGCFPHVYPHPAGHVRQNGGATEVIFADAVPLSPQTGQLVLRQRFAKPLHLVDSNVRLQKRQNPVILTDVIVKVDVQRTLLECDAQGVINIPSPAMLSDLYDLGQREFQVTIGTCVWTQKRSRVEAINRNRL